jgi:hypothetical protein
MLSFWRSLFSMANKVNKIQGYTWTDSVEAKTAFSFNVTVWSY